MQAGIRQGKGKLDALYEQKGQARREALLCLKTVAGTFAGWAAHYWLSLKIPDQPKAKGRGRKGNSLIQYHPGKSARLFPHAAAVSHLREMQRRTVRSRFRTGLLRQHEPATIRRQTENKTEGEGACMLSHFLMGEMLPKPDKEKWKEDIMNLLGIDDTYYKSKYKEPVSDFPSDSNQEFAKEMRSIFR